MRAYNLFLIAVMTAALLLGMGTLLGLALVLLALFG